MYMTNCWGREVSERDTAGMSALANWPSEFLLQHLEVYSSARRRMMCSLTPYLILKQWVWVSVSSCTFFNWNICVGFHDILSHCSAACFTCCVLNESSKYCGVSSNRIKLTLKHWVLYKFTDFMMWVVGRKLSPWLTCILVRSSVRRRLGLGPLEGAIICIIWRQSLLPVSH